MESPLAPNPHSRTAAPLRPPSLSSAATPTNPSPALLPSVLLPPPCYEPSLPCLRRPRASPPSSSHAPPRARRQRRAPRGPRAVQPVQSPTVQEESRGQRIQQRRHGRELGLDGESSGVGAAAKARWVGDGGRLAGRSSRSKEAEVIQIWRWFMILDYIGECSLVNVLGLVQQLSLGQDKHISWIQRLEMAEIECI